MTPAVDAAAAGVVVGAHPYEHDPAHESYGLEAAAGSRSLLAIDFSSPLLSSVAIFSARSKSSLMVRAVPVNSTGSLATIAVPSTVMSARTRLELVSGHT